MRKRFSSILLPAVTGLCLCAAAAGYAGDERGERSKGLTANQIYHVSVKDIRILEFIVPENLGGEIQVRTDVDMQEALIEVDENVHNVSDKDQANRILESITLESTSADNILHIEIKTPDEAEWEGTNIGAQVDMTVLIPPGLAIHGKSDHFNFDLSGPFPEVVLIGQYGKIRVENVTERTDLHSEYGSLILISAQGKVAISSQYGTATLEDIRVGGEPMRIQGGRGSIDLERIDGPVNINAEDSPVSITEWTLRAGESRIASRSAPIQIDFAEWGKPELIIENRRSKIDIGVPENFSAAIRLGLREEGRGYIRTRGIPIKATRMNQKTLEGIAGTGGGLLQVSNREGDITLRGPGARAGDAGSL